MLLLVGILFNGEIVGLVGEIVAVEAGGAGSKVSLWRGFGAEGGGGVGPREAEFGGGGESTGGFVRWRRRKRRGSYLGYVHSHPFTPQFTQKKMMKMMVMVVIISGKSCVWLR